LDDIAVRKQEVRREIRRNLAALSGPRLTRKSRSIARRLFTTSWWQESDWVFAYIAMAAEVETQPIIVQAYRERKQVAIPRMEGQVLAFYRYEGRTRELLPNQFGIYEPDPLWLLVDPPRLQGQRLLVLVPGLGFDRERRRLGRGKGYYDRLLAGVRRAGVAVAAVGLAFSEQLVEQIPVSDHDQPLDGVITDEEIIF
jgi:5-formyltetrahydrofolate cyclo-ligase